MTAAMTPFQFADDLARGNIQCRKQGRGAMAPVIVRVRFR